MAAKKLLLIYKRSADSYVYARYEGRSLSHRFEASAPLPLYWVMEILNAPNETEKTLASAA